MTKVDLTSPKSRDEFAQYLVTYEIEPSIKAQGDLPERRKKNYSIMRNESGCSGQQNIAPNYKPFHVPFTQPRVSLIAGGLYQRFTAMTPIVQITPLGDTTLEMSNEVENLVQAVFTRGGIDIELPLAAETAAVCGVSVPRLYPEEGKGLCLETLHPDDTIAYPSTARCVKDCKTFGHRFYMSVSQIEAQMEKKGGPFYDVEGIIGKSLNHEDLPGSPIAPRSQPEEGVVQSTDEPVECWELHSRRDIGEGEKLYRIVLLKRVPKLLQIEELEFSRPWYFEGRLHIEWGGFYPEGSIAQNLQGMQHLYTDLHNALVAGSYAAMSPRTIVSGGALGEKWFTMGFGDVYQSPTPVDVTVIPSSFNPAALPAMIQEVDSKGDSIARTSRVGQGRQLKGRTTKAEADMLQAGGDDAMIQYASHFARFLKEMAEFILEFARKHPDFTARHYPEAMVSQEALDGQYHIEASGRTSGNLPSVQNEKLQQAYVLATQANAARMAMQMPPVYDEVAIVDAAMETLQLPMNPKKFKYPEQQNGNGSTGDMGLDPAQMAGDMGFSGMEGPAGMFGGLPTDGSGLSGFFRPPQAA